MTVAVRPAKTFDVKGAAAAMALSPGAFWSVCSRSRAWRSMG
jgi:hypothetical protein